MPWHEQFMTVFSTLSPPASASALAVVKERAAGVSEVTTWLTKALVVRWQEWTRFTATSQLLQHR